MNNIKNYNDPYPCGGGKVEKLEWEERHGWTDNKKSNYNDYHDQPDWKIKQENEHLVYYDSIIRGLD